jgi:hypothetical protein
MAGPRRIALCRMGMASRDGQSSVRVKWRRGAQSQLASGRGGGLPWRDRLTQLASPTCLPCARGGGGIEGIGPRWRLTTGACR